MYKLLLLLTLTISTSALAHPNGTYQIDNQEDVTVTFEYLNRCPVDLVGAMSGGLRSLLFSEAASDEPYAFLTSFYVETHINGKEVYVQTDESCTPIIDGEEISASRRTFGPYSLLKIQ